MLRCGCLREISACKQEANFPFFIKVSFSMLPYMMLVTWPLFYFIDSGSEIEEFTEQISLLKTPSKEEGKMSLPAYYSLIV